MIHFSVVTVVKNDLVGLNKSRESLEAQLHKNWTHIIIDGKSDAATLKYLRGLPKENTTWVSELDSGIYSAMNKGWKIADPESFVFYLNARDVFADKKSLSAASEALAAKPKSGWGCTTHEEIEPDGNGWVCKLVSPPSAPNQLYAYGYRSHQGVIMKAKFIESLRGFDESYKIAADWDLIVKAILTEAPTIWWFPIAIFQLGGESSHRLLEAHMELRSLRRKYLIKGITHRIYDDLWCATYLRFFGWKNYFSPAIAMIYPIRHINKKQKRLIKSQSDTRKLTLQILIYAVTITRAHVILVPGKYFLSNIIHRNASDFLIRNLHKKLQIKAYEFPAKLSES